MSSDQHPGWSAWDEMKLLQDFSTKIWQMYINWFTWSLGANLLAISYIITRLPKIDAVLVKGLGAVMIISLAFAIIGGLRLRSYFRATVAHARTLASVGGTKGPDVGLLFGETLAVYVHWAIPATLAVVLAAWAVLIFKFGL